MRLSIPSATAGGTHDASGNVAFEDASGIITLTPDPSSNNGVALNLPYYAVTRARSEVDARFDDGNNPSIKLDNHGGGTSGDRDFSSWGLQNTKTGAI